MKTMKFNVDKIKELTTQARQLRAVTSVRLLKNDIISVSTKELKCTDPRTGATHDIGKFNIRIPTTADFHYVGDYLKFLNKTRRVRGLERNMHAPHVFQSGEGCLGTAVTGLREAYNNSDLYMLLLLSIQFLESVFTDDDAGNYIDKWPVIYKPLTRYKLKKEKDKIGNSDFNKKKMCELFLKGHKIYIYRRDGSFYGTCNMTKTRKISKKKAGEPKQDITVRIFRQHVVENPDFKFFVNKL